MAKIETPMGLSLIVCDTIIEDKFTTKKTLVGLFDRIQVGKMPCVHPDMSVFVSLTGGRGEYPCEVICRHTDGETVAFSAKGMIKLSDPRQVVDLVFRMKNVQFSKAGIYWLNFVVDGVPIMMRQLVIKHQAMSENGQEL